MSTQNNQDSSDRFALKIAGLTATDEQKPSLEKAADDLADKVDDARHLDPLDAEPAIIFDPR
ncbi:MAG: hypothetical protein H8E81_02525 [Deltaproteobacteria bacterium]|nr:hypothetical protein [Deltaproteobacteria bacterium]